MGDLLAKKPKGITERQQGLISAFNMLSSERQIIGGLTPQTISEDSMYTYIQRYGAPDIPNDLFVYAIHCIDNHYLPMLNQKIKNQIKRSQNGNHG